jgi:hypothetical protein
MKIVRILPLLLFFLFSCEPYPTPYFIIYTNNSYDIEPGEVLKYFRIQYEFRCDDAIEYMDFEIIRNEGSSNIVLYSTPAPIIVPRKGALWFNTESTPRLDLVLGDYTINAVLLSDRYGTPQEIESMHASCDFVIE